MVRVLVCSTFLASVAVAQQSAEIRVRDDRGAPVPYAVVTIGSGLSRVADTTGTIPVRVTGDSILLHVRRMGYKPFDGWTRRTAERSYDVHLPRLVATLDTVTVTERETSPLEQRGFYDRLQRVQRGAIVGEFMTPEDLDFRNAMQVSNILLASRYARIVGAPGGRNGRVKLITGRAGCRMTVLLDGQKVEGTVQDVGGGGLSRSGDPNTSIDDIVPGAQIMAVEVYPSTANAPFELVRVSGTGSCGIVALWTGGRR